MAIRNTPTQEELQNQLTDLKAEILELSRTIASTTTSAADRAKPVMDDVNDRVHEAADAAWQQGKAIMDSAKENPGVATTVVVAAGLFGLALAWFLNSSSQRY